MPNFQGKRFEPNGVGLPRPEPYTPPPAPPPSAATHVFVGMYRPTLEEIDRIIANGVAEKIYYCPFGHEARYMRYWVNLAKKCWKSGCYDTPVYVTVKDLLKPIHDVLIDSLRKAEKISKGGLPG